MNEEQEPEVFLYPPWRQAAANFLTAGYKPGDIVKHEWFLEQFGIEPPKVGVTLTKEVLAQIKANELEYVRQMSMLRDHLLKCHQIDLTTKPGVGYEVTPPADQSRLAFAEGVRDIRSGLRKMGNRISNVDLTALTAEQRRENADALAKTAKLAGMLRETRKLPRLMSEEAS